MMSASQSELFKTQKPENSFPPVIIELKGLEVAWLEKTPKGKVQRILRGIPSFKTGKTAFAWRDRVTGRIMARPLTLPHHKKWMEKAILSIMSQLSSGLGITPSKIRTVASPRSWIASFLPLNDSWRWLRRVTVDSRLCREGEEEGATITIQRIR